MDSEQIYLYPELRKLGFYNKAEADSKICKINQDLRLKTCKLIDLKHVNLYNKAESDFKRYKIN